MKEPLFTGVCTALVTPFLDGKVNYPMLEQLLRRQLDAGVRAVVLAGTTGESATLIDEEKLEIFRRAKAFTGKDCLIIAGTGSNDTAHAVDLSRKAQAAGADALLIVSPYYNKGSSQGLYLHYLSIAEAVSLPIIVYNVPSRTGMDIPVEIYRRLCELPNIAGVKEATTDIRKLGHILSECGADFPIWCGNDDLTVPAMALGARGVISVLSNLCPVETDAMVQAALAGDFDTAAALQLRLLPLIDLLFCEVNPIPIKAAMIRAGYDCGGCRLPLTQLSPEHSLQLEKLLT